MSEAYRIAERCPTIDEYRMICREVGWEPYINFDVAEASLQHSLFAVVALHGDRAIGMGRVVGDGHIYFYIQDIAVIPEYQYQGIGTLIMDRLVSILRQRAPEQAFIGLFAANGKESFYRKYGLDLHDGLVGMFGVQLDGKIG